MKVRYHYVLTGRVQGVGFRWKATHLAESLGITGWVRNEWDGSVEMELQGEEELQDRMLADFRRDRYIEIDRVERTKIEVLEDERYFDVRF
ncbi:MAG: acylphosphatase [Eubacterium sp.]|nr:acylphosphatase [Eubacterium sp.]